MAKRDITVRGADGRVLTRLQRLASSLVQHPYDQSRLVRGAIISSLLAVFWLVAAVSRLVDGSRIVAGFLMVGAVFFSLRAVANSVLMSSLGGGRGTSVRSDDVADR